MSGEHGRKLKPAEFTLSGCDGIEGLSEQALYAKAAQLVAERAPLRIEPGELIAGAATLLEATKHQTPLLHEHGNWSTSHTTIGFHRVLPLGYRELRRQVRDRLKRGGIDAKGADVLNAMLGCLDAAQIWHRRHVELLNERISQSEGSLRETYRSVLAALQNVPENPPESFHEALQSLWFMYAFQRLMGNWSGIGRIDEMLGTYLEGDLKAGRVTLDCARELLAHFWIKGCEWTTGEQNTGSGDAQFYQNIILGGIDADGNEITNDVTYLVLDVVDEFVISDFPIAVRISKRTPEKLLRRITQVQRRGGGIVAIYSEDAVIRALTDFGYELHVARTFVNDGCWEVIIPGRTAFGYTPIDLVPMLHDAMGVNTPDAPPADYPDFESLYRAFVQRVAGRLDEFHTQADSHELNGRAAPLLSLFVEDCIERGRDYHDRGARYSVLAPHAGGLPDVANEFIAVKRLVYETRELTLSDLARLLHDDWSKSEALRRRIRNRLPFYGNDDAETDAMVRRVFEDWTRLAGAIRERNGVLRPPGLSTFGRQIEWAAARGATAAGTRKGEFLSSNFSPAPGTDRHGPTAVIKSFCSVDFTRLPNGTALDLKVHPSGLKSESGLNALVSLLKTFVDLGGWFMHVDVVDTATLRDAQRHPGRYPYLPVRIAGWSARFVTLTKDWQDMIIERTEQDLR